MKTDRRAYIRVTKIFRQDMVQRTGISSGHDNKIRSEGSKNDQQEINMRIVGISDELV